MKLSTLEQLTDAVERIASRLDSQEPYKVDLSTYLTKAEASDTYAVKINGVFRSEDEVVNEFGHITFAPAGTVWINTSGNTPYLYTTYNGSYWYIPFTEGVNMEPSSPIEDYDDSELDWEP